MKIVCIIEFKSQPIQHELTRFKTYEVIDDEYWIGNYLIVCDRGYRGVYKKSYFQTLQEFRSNKLDLLI